MNNFEMDRITKFIAKCRKYIPKDRKKDWDDFVLRAKLDNMHNDKGLEKVMKVAEVVMEIEKGKKQGLTMSEILSPIEDPFKYYLLVKKYSNFGDEYLKYYVEKHGDQENEQE